MTTWRGAASQQTQDEIDRLLNLALEHAAQLLKDGNRLVPFAAAIIDDGAAKVLAGLVTATGSARADLDLLYAEATRRIARYHAVAFTAPITLDGGPAVRIEAEHHTGVALALRVPYRTRFLGGVRFGTMQLDKGPTRLWRHGHS